MITLETETTGLSKALSELSACVGSDSQAMLRVESGQLAWRIAQEFGPGNFASARTKVQKNVKMALYAPPPRPFSGVKANGKDGTQWLYAGPHFLAGVSAENNRMSRTDAETLKVYYRAKSQEKYGFSGSKNKFLDVGKRGPQHVMMLNRAMVTPVALSGVIRAIQANIGQAKASFAFATAQTTHKPIAGWIAKHFSTRVKDKAIFSEAGLANGTTPFMEIGSRAPGVVSNPKMVRAIQNGIKQKLLNDYAYDYTNGRVFKRKAGTFDRN